MKKFTLLFLTSLLIFACDASKKTVVTAVKNNNGNLIGIANKASFSEEPYNTWFTKNYDDYTPDPSIIADLKLHLKGVNVKGFMGTWCGDSKRETPKFYKVLDATGFNENNIELVTVNHSKKTPDNLQEGFDVKRVPTFIFYKDGKEIGRFVEYPRETIEKDFLKIVSKQNYKHSYEK